MNADSLRRVCSSSTLRPAVKPSAALMVTPPLATEIARAVLWISSSQAPADKFGYSSCSLATEMFVRDDAHWFARATADKGVLAASPRVPPLALAASRLLKLSSASDPNQ